MKNLIYLAAAALLVGCGPQSCTPEPEPHHEDMLEGQPIHGWEDEQRISGVDFHLMFARQSNGFKYQANEIVSSNLSEAVDNILDYAQNTHKRKIYLYVTEQEADPKSWQVISTITINPNLKYYVQTPTKWKRLN